MTGIINLFVDELFGASGTETGQRVLARLREEFQVGSEDWNDVTFTRQRIRWMKDPLSCIEVSHEKAIEELEEISVGRNTKENLRCTRAIHTRYRSLLGQKSLLQMRIQFQCCCNMSRSASKAASPIIGDVKKLSTSWRDNSSGSQ